MRNDASDTFSKLHPVLRWGAGVALSAALALPVGIIATTSVYAANDAGPRPATAAPIALPELTLPEGLTGADEQGPEPSQEQPAETTDKKTDEDQATRSKERESKDEKDKKPAEAPEKKDAEPKPVAGLDDVQMHNAYLIVQAGEDLDVPKRGQVIALMTAMQESNLLNRASEVLPDSKKYEHQGSGSDHDSIGLFQQRPSSGWGSIKEIMDPDYAAKAFYKGLLDVHGWEDMPLGAAAQTVQVSAFPDAYDKHEDRAKEIVDAIHG